MADSSTSKSTVVVGLLDVEGGVKRFSLEYPKDASQLPSYVAAVATAFAAKVNGQNVFYNGGINFAEENNKVKVAYAYTEQNTKYYFDLGGE